VAGDANEARAILGRRAPDLILMDIQLPGIDGLTFVRQLRSEPATAGIPVVALTARAMAGDRERSLAAGCSGYIPKPINTRTFVSEVRKFLPRP
jgi:CheY-like chemotaxis protein